MSRLFEPRGVNVSSDVSDPKSQGAIGKTKPKPMCDAVAEGVEAHRRLLAGEITQREYELERAEICARHGI